MPASIIATVEVSGTALTTVRLSTKKSPSTLPVGPGLDTAPGQATYQRFVTGLREVEGVSFTFFESRDVVRHPLVASMIGVL